jgi:hypothetical protein
MASTGAIGMRERDFLIGELEEGEMAVDQWGNVTTAAEGYWEDLRFPAQGINPAGSAAPPSVDTSTFPGTLLFSHLADNHVAGVAQLPHGWQRGTAVRPHIHWCPVSTESGTVLWQLRYALGDIGEVLGQGNPLGAYCDWITGTRAVGSGNIADTHVLTTFGDITLTSLGESGMILWELRRKASDNADNYGGSARLLELDFHYQTNKSGTKDEVPA